MRQRHHIARPTLVRAQIRDIEADRQRRLAAAPAGGGA
jgi:hypothetical protein